MPVPAGVTVLMPTFNRARYIRAALESVLNQTRKPLEIIVIDDGSTDETAAVCAAFGAAVSYVRQDRNQGKSAALNLGLSHARGEFIWVMDDDDIAPREALETLLSPMLRDPELGFTFGQLRKFSQDGDGPLVLAPPERPPVDDGRSLFVRLMEDCFITGQPCALIRKVCFDAIGEIDTSVQVSVDYNILLQIARRFRGADVGAVVLLQRQHNGVRGPAAQQYDADRRCERWAASDKRLLGDLLPRLALPEYLGLPATVGPLSPRETRTALLQKAVIAARKNLWPEAARALNGACALAVDATLSAWERHILQHMLGSRYGIDPFIGDADTQHLIIHATGATPLGGDVRCAIAGRLTYWIGVTFRQRDLARLASTSVALVKLAGWRWPAVAATPVVRRLIPALRDRRPTAPTRVERPA